MLLDQPRTRQRAFVLAALIGSSMSVLSCTSKTSSTLAITQPKAGQTFNLADDIDADVPGVQLMALVQATRLEGATVTLTGPDKKTATGVVHNGVAKITFTLAASGSLVATAKDSKGLPVTSAAVAVKLDTSPQACRFASPVGGSTLGPSDNAYPTSGGFGVDVKVRCVGVELGNNVALSVNGATYASSILGAGGIASFTDVELAEGANSLEADTQTNAGVAVRTTETVTVKTGSCRVLLSPPTGTVFNAHGEGPHGVANLNPAPPMNANLTVTADARCVGDTLTVNSGAAALATTTIHSTSTTVPVVLPDGTDPVRAVLSGAAHGASPLAVYTVDSVVPTATITYPVEGQQLTDKDDKDPATPGLQIEVVGKVTGVDPKNPDVILVLDGGAPVPVTPDETGTFTVLTTGALADGSHSLYVKLTRPSGTTATSPTIHFTSSYLGASLQMTSPTDGELFPLANDADPNTAGYQVVFTLSGTNLANATGLVQCGVASGSFTLGGSGLGSATLTFSNLPCQGENVTCSATVTASNNTTFSTPPVKIFIDDVPPVVHLLTPTPGSVLPSNVVAVTATTECPGEAQTATLLRGTDVLVAPAAVPNNSVDFPQVTLPAGNSSLKLEVSDAAGNVTPVPFDVTVDSEVPQLVFVQPPSGSPVTWTQADDADHDPSNGFQHDVVIQLDNKPAPATLYLWMASQSDPTNLIPAQPFSEATQAASGHNVATFPGLTIPEGAWILHACSTDGAGNQGCTDQDVVVDTGAPTCLLTLPGSGADLGPSDDLEPGVPGLQTNVVVSTSASGSSAGVSLDVQAPDSSHTTTSTDVANGVATFQDVTFTGEGAYTLQATCTAADGTTSQSAKETVWLQLNAPTPTIDQPTDGTVFNAASPNESTQPGFHTNVEVSATAGPNQTLANAGLSVSVDCGQGQPTSYPCSIPPAPEPPSTLTVACLVTLPDMSACTLTATLTDGAGNQSTSAPIHVTVDRTPPTVAFNAPPNNSLFGKARDADPNAPGFQLDQVTVTATGGTGLPTLDVGGQVATCGGGTACGATPTTDTAGVFSWTDVDLAEGANTLHVSISDAAGNVGSADDQVTVKTTGPVVMVDSLINGEVLSLKNDTDPTKSGIQVNIGLTGQDLVSGTTIYICSPQVAPPPTLPASYPCIGSNGQAVGELASTTLTSDTAVVQDVSLPDGTVTLFAVAVDQAGNSSSPSQTVTVTVDSTPPQVTSPIQIEQVAADGTATPLDTQNGIATFGQKQSSGTGPLFQTRLVATITDATGESVQGLTAKFFDSNPASQSPLATVTTDANGLATADVSLPDGGHAIYVETWDQAGNVDSTPPNPIPNEAPTVLNFATKMKAPVVTILSPTAGKLLVKDDLDPNTPGLQYNVQVYSDAYPATVLLALDNPTNVIASAPLSTNGTVTKQATFPDGSHTLYAVVTDAAGNTTTAQVLLLIDDTPPIIAITAPTNGATLSTDADPSTPGFQASVTVTYSQVETGQPLKILVNGSTFINAQTDTTGTLTNFVTLQPGSNQTLTAQTWDVNGNPASSTVTVNVAGNAPAISFQSTENPMYFGLADGTTPDGASCDVSIPVNGTEGATATLLVNGSAAGNAETITNGAATFANVTIANGATVTLQLEATQAGDQTGYSEVRQATCDLTQPTVSLTSPTGGSLTYVAYGNPGNVPGAIANKVPGSTLDADFTVQVTGADGGAVALLDGTTTVTTLPVSGSDASVTFSNVTLAQGSHQLTFTAKDLAGNPGSTPAILVTVDVIPPGPADATAKILDYRQSLVELDFTAPADDGATGSPVAGYQVRRSSAPITDDTSWAAATPVNPPNLVPPTSIAAPGTLQALTVTGLPFEQTYYFAVRALDAVGNLGVVSSKVTSADLHLSRIHLGVPEGSNFSQVRLATGDLDGDGMDDIVAASSSANSGAGEVDVYYGSATLTSTTSCASTPGCVELVGPSGSDFGSSVAIGDVNGDHLPDLIVGADSVTAPGSQAGTKDGAVYIYLSHPNSRLTSTSTPDVTIYGKLSSTDAGPGIGDEVVVADVNGDGIGDLLLGSPNENNFVGKVYVFAGRASWPATESTATDALATITGVGTTYTFGLHIAALGDLSHDQHDDFAVSGSYGAGPHPVYVVSGALATGTPAVNQISAEVPPPTLATGDHFGFDLDAGDVTGDGVKDLVISDYANPTPSTGWVIDGATIGQALPTAPLTGSPPKTPVVPASADLATLPFNSTGFVLLRAIPDINEDGLDDIAGAVVGASATNQVEVFFGRPTAQWPGSAGAVTQDVTLGEVSGSQEGTSFGVRVGAGYFVTPNSGSNGPRDLVVLDSGGTATVLSNP